MNIHSQNILGNHNTSTQGSLQIVHSAPSNSSTTVEASRTNSSSLLQTTSENLDSFSRTNYELVENRQGVNKQVQWAMNAFPLPVFIEGNPETADFIFATLREWEAFSGGLIRVSRLESSPENRWSESILFTWVDDATHGRENEVGHTDRRIRQSSPDRPGYITHATISLLHSPAIDATLSIQQKEQRLRATVLHEMGHALGLEHSPNPKDIMHHQGWRNTQLQPGDLTALNQRYARAFPSKTNFKF